MKLHLPKSLRTALLTCLAAMAPVAVTLATGAISSGLVAFSISAAYAVDETGDLTSDTNWNASTDHSADTTTVSGATLKVGNGSGGDANLAADSVIKLGTITLQTGATIDVYGGTVADRDSSTDGKIVLEGDITLNNSVLYFSDGSYYVKNTLAVEGSSTVRSKWGKAVVLNSLTGDEDAVLTLANQSNGGNPAGFYIGTGSNTDALFDGTIKFVDESKTRTVQVVLNDGTALSNAALELDSYSNVIIALERVLAEAVYGTGTIGNASTGNYGTNAEGATLTIVGQAANNQVFSGSVNSQITWQIGDGSTAASSRFSGATLNGTLNIQGNSAAYLAETNTINKLTGNGTVNVTSGTTAVTTAEAANGSLYNVSSGAALNFTNFAIASGSTVYFAGSGNVSLGSLTNDGVLDFSSMNGAIGTYTITDGFSLDVSTLGTVANAESLNWNSLLGNSAASGYNAVYADGVVSAVAIADPTLHWSATSEGQSWNGSYSWQVESVWANPSATDTSYVLGADATYKSIVVDSDVDMSAATLSVNGAYSLSVAQGASYSFNLNDTADSITFAEGASLTKVGAGTLKMTSTDALNAGIIVDAGILELSTRDNVSGKTITVNENGTLVFGGDSTSSSVQVDVDGTGRVEVVFVDSGNHSRNVQLGSDFNGTLAISGLFALTECQVGSDATYEFASGEFWTGGGSVSNNLNVVGDSADAFRMRSGGALTLSGVVTGNYSVGHSSNTGTIILANTNSAGTIDLDYGTLQLGNDASSIFGDSTSYHSGITVNVAAGATLAVRYGNANKTKASEAYQLGSVINIKGDARVDMPDGSTYFVNAINVDSGKTFTFVNQWDKHQFLSGITGENVNVVIESPNQGGNAGLRMVVLTGESEESFSGTLTIKKLEDNAVYQRGVAVQSGEVLENVVVSFADEQQGALLLFTDSSYDAAQTMDAAPKANGSVAGLSGTEGKVYAAGLTINTGADTSYTYGGELNITSLTKSGAGAQSLTQGLNLTGALNVQAGTLTLAGIVGVASITNTGIIDITAVETLTIGDLTATDGGSYAIGTLTGYESKDWNALLGVSQDYQVDYSGGNLLFSVDDGTSAIWVGGTGAVWDGTDSAGNATQSWVKEGTDFVPSSLSSLILGNADTLTAAGYTDAEVSREIIVDSDVAVKSLTVQDSYSLSVAENESYSFEATSITMEEGATLTKTGEGTLVIGKDVTAITGIEDGTLKLDGALNNATGVDLTRFSGDGTLAITASGTSGQATDGNKMTGVTLSDSFTGTLSVVGGHLDATNTDLGGASGVLLDGGTLFSSGDNTVKTVDWNVAISDNGGYFCRNGNSAADETTTYAANFTGKLTGSDASTLTIIDAGEWFFTADSDLSEWKGSIVIGGNQNNVAFQSAADFKALTVNGGHKVTVSNAVTVDTLTHSGSAFTVTGADAHLTATTSDINTALTVTNGATGNFGAVTAAAGIQLDFTNSGTTGSMDSLVMEGDLTLHLNEGAALTIGKEGVAGQTEVTGKTLTIHVWGYSPSTLTDYNTLVVGEGRVVDVSGMGTYSVAGVTQTGGEIKLGTNGKMELNGAVALTNISNSGTLDLSGATSLSLAGFNDAATTVDGTQNFTLGAVADSTEIAWNTLTGVSIADYRVKYSSGTVSYAAVGDTYIVWADTDDAESAWGEGSNWRWADDNSLAAVPTSVNKVQLTADAAQKTLTLNGAASVAELKVQGAYNLAVESGNTATLTATTVTMEDGASLTKTGEGTLTMSKDNAVAGGISISEGTLKLSETSYENDSAHDLSSITASSEGTLQMNGSENSWASGLNYGISVTLSDAFEGTLKMTSGQLNVNNVDDRVSDFGGAKAISLEGATVAIGGGQLSVPELIFTGDNTTILSHGTSTIASDISGSGTINRHGGGSATLNLTGDISYAGTFIQQKATLNLAGDSAAYIKNLRIQGGTVTISSGLNSDSGLTVTGGTTNLNGSSDLGSVSMSGGTFAVNADTQINELSVTGGTFKINGAAVNIDSLKSSSLTLTGAASLNAVLADTAQVALTGAATADVTLAVVENGNASLSVAESLKTLTVRDGGALALTGALTLGDLYNSGSLDITGLTALNIGGLSLVAGAQYEVGTLTSTNTIDWNTLLGLDSSLEASYDGVSTLSIAAADNIVLWVGDTNSTWDEADENGASTAWKQGDTAFNPGAKSAVVLGNAVSLEDLNDAVVRTIILDSDTVVGSVTVQDAYSLSVADGSSHSFDAGTIVLDGGSLSKTGAGTLSMSLEDAVAAQMNIAEGTLNISGALADTSPSEVAPIDMSTLSGVGTLSITAAGANGGTSDGTRTNVVLGDGFTGSLLVSGGQLDADSTIGGASLVVLDGATLTDTHGDGVHTVAWNIKVTDNDAYLRHFGYDNSDNRDSYATRLTGTLTGSANAMLTVIDAGEWFLAGDMSDYAGGLSITGNTNYVTFESSATLASLTAVNNSHILVDNNAALTTSTLAVSGTVYTGATEGATLNMGAVTINTDATLKIEGTGSHALSTLAMGNNATLELAAGTSASITTATAGTTTATGGAYPGARDGVRELVGTDFTIKVGEGAGLTDAGAWELYNGSDMTVNGGGLYHVAGIALGTNGGNGNNTLTIESGTTLHITGTNTTGARYGDSFSLGNSDPNNSVTVRGVLELECGLSTAKNPNNEGHSYKGYAEINVEDGGKLAFNRGFHATVSRRGNYTDFNAVPDEIESSFKHVAINIAGGAVLEISGTNTEGTGDVVVNMEQNSILMGGNANNATESKITNNLNFEGGAYIGAKVGTTFTIALEDASTNLKWMDIIGTGDNQGISQGAGGTVKFASAVVVDSAFKVLTGATAEFDATLNVGWVEENSGTLTVDGAFTANSITNNAGGEATFNAGISLRESEGSGANINNSGKLTVNGDTAMYSIRNNAGAEAVFNGTVGASSGNIPLIYNSGKITFNGNVDWMHQIHNLEGGEMVFTDSMEGSYDALVNAGKLVFDSADNVDLLKSIQNSGTVEVLNASGTRFTLADAMLTANVDNVVKTWTLVNNDATGTVTGWDALTLENFLLNGAALEQGDWDAVSIADGKVSLYMLYRYWDSAEGDSNVWDTNSGTVWRDRETMEGLVYESGSRVAFGEYEDVDDINQGTGTTPLNKNVTVAEGGVVAKALDVFGEGYVFSGGKVTVTQSMSIQESAEFASTLVIGSTTSPLAVEVWAGKTLTVGTLETSSSVSYGSTIYNNGALSMVGEGTMHVTDAVNGKLTQVSSLGTLKLGVEATDGAAAKTITLAVGSNELTTAGGTLQNVVLTAADNSIAAADSTLGKAVLTDVSLEAGAAASYATLQDVSFAGNSALSGYIALTAPESMQVAAGSTLEIGNLTLDLAGTGLGEQVVIANGATTSGLGTLNGWTTDKVSLVYNGVAVNEGSVTLSDTAGKLTIASTADSALYWDGIGADGNATGDWNTTAAAWNTSEGADDTSTYKALSDIIFGTPAEGGSKTITVAADMDMLSFTVKQGGYSFSGAGLNTLGAMSVAATGGDVSFRTVLTSGDTLATSGDGKVSFGEAVTAAKGITLGSATTEIAGAMTATNGNIAIMSKTINVAGAVTAENGDITITSGNSERSGEGRLTLTNTGSLTAQNISIHVDAGASTDSDFSQTFVDADGSITATDTLSITGTATKDFTGGTITADKVIVNTGSSNLVEFATTDIGTLTIESGTRVDITGDSAIDTIVLKGTLGMTKFSEYYGGNNNPYNVVAASADAYVEYATIVHSYFAVTGDTGVDGQPYGSITFGPGYRDLTITSLEKVQNLNIGAAEYWAKLNNATGGIHGNFTAIGGSGVELYSNDIMAETNTTGQWVLGTTLKLLATTQTLRGNTVNMSGAVITGNADAVGLSFAESSVINYGGSNTISANMTVAADKTLTLKAGYAAAQDQTVVAQSSDDTLLLSGALSGSGALNLTGDGVVTISNANSGYTGTVTVGGGSSLELTNANALSAAAISVAGDGTLVLNAGAPVNVAGLAIADGASLSLIGLAATDAADLTAAGLINANANGITWNPTGDSMTLNVFLDKEVENMMTYNLFTDKQALASSGVTLNVYHNGELLDASQYNVGYDADKKLVYIRTMIGNIWSGGTKLDGETYTADGIWALAENNTDGNWSGKNYTDNKAAIFVDAPTTESGNNYVKVTLTDVVSPGDVYFEADATYYQLISAADDATAGLAAGTDIHKAGSAYVNLSLANNGTMENAIGNIDLQNGHIYLGADLAVSGEVVVAKDALLRTYEASLVTDSYTAKGDYSNLVMQSDRIAGESAENKGVISSCFADLVARNVSIVANAGETVLLENVTLKSVSSSDSDSLTNVTIGSNVDVTGNYTLKGAMVFNETLTNTGTVTLDAAMTAEIGQLGYSFTVDDEGASWYTYQLVQGGTINGMSDLLVGDVTIGGVSLGSGLAEGVATYITNSDGSITLSIGNVTGTDSDGNVTVDGSIGVPQWDERWGAAENQPSLSRRYSGTTADTNVSFAEGITDDGDYYWYSSVVNAENADKVNGTGNEVVVTLSSASTGTRAAGGSSAASKDLEMWVYDRSGFTTVIAGQYADAATDAYKQSADTHVLVNSTYDGADDDTDVDEKTWVVGGSWNVAQNANSYVTVQDGKILTLVGGSKDADQVGTSYVYIDGGRLFEVTGSSFASEGSTVTHSAADGESLASRMVITGGTLGGAASDGGTKSVYGGGIRTAITGDIWVTVDGTASITNLVGGNYGGSVTGNITLDLVNGTVATVHAAGNGSSTVTGNVLVNLGKDFVVSGGLYGGRENDSGVSSISGSSTLNFMDAGATYDVTGYSIQGFDTISLADGTYVKTSTGSGFATDSASGLLTVSGGGTLELTGTTDIGRDIKLEDGATLWFNSDHAGNWISTQNPRSTLTATAGTTIDITGQPGGGDGLCVWLDLAGHGVDNKGALYKGLSGAATDPAGKVALPRITLSDSASINAVDNIYVIECQNAEAELFLQGNTLTKVGANKLTFFNTTVDTGNIYVKEGTLGVGYSMRAESANVILGGGSTLDITSAGDTVGTAKIGSLSGSGDTNLSYILQVTTNDTGNYIIDSDYMTRGADAYGQFSADTGFAYGVYSGKISGASSLYVSGDGTQYLSGSESDYSGGTHLTDNSMLYLLGGTEGTATKGASTVTSGVLGTGAIAWDSADATLYLGNGVRVYNNGVCNVDGSSIIIGVEGAPVGAKLAEGSTYLGVHSRGENGSITYITLDNKEYVEVATHNLQSISCDGMYADGTAYVAGTEIDRNKMLLVSKEVWAANEATVTGFSGNGYNEAIYSGVLSGNVSFEKVGIGTLVLDQANEYTGSTTISEGSLVLKGWAQIGSAADGASINVEQQEGTSLVLAYDGSYGDEITGIANNITLTGEGDARWKTDAEHMATSALISDVGADVAFTLSGDISGDGGILHSGAGTLVLSGDSSFTGGTHASNGVVEVQSATGLGSGVVTVDSSSDLHVTVEDGTTASRLATTIKAPGSSVKGDVVINGTETTERILNIAVSTNADKSQGYTAPTTTVGDNGTLLLNGDGINAETDKLSGSGTVAVSDATAGSAGSKMTVNGVAGFTGDFVVEGKDASIDLQTGAFRGGSISVSGNGANVTTKGDVTIVSGESLSLTSKGNAGETDTSAALRTTGAVNVTNGATLSVAAAETSYEYNLQNLQASASLDVGSDLESGAEGQAYTAMGTSAEEVYKGFFNTSVAMNQKAAGSVDAEGGLTLSGGASYETSMANTSLMGGTLTLDTTTTSLLNFDATLDAGQAAIDGSGRTTQLLLFSDVGGVNFVLDDMEADAGTGIYYTRADRYITGCDYVDEETWLVYDSSAQVVYLEGLIPEPTTATLSLLALAALAARRRRK